MAVGAILMQMSFFLRIFFVVIFVKCHRNVAFYEEKDKSIQNLSRENCKSICVYANRELYIGIPLLSTLDSF